MVTTGRVIYDGTFGEHGSPKAAVLDPTTLEGRVHAPGHQGRSFTKPI